MSRGETLAIVRFGLRKSHALAPAGGLDAPTTGRVELMGRDLSAMGERERGAWRNQHLGFVYQFHLLPEFSALGNVAIPRIRRQSVTEARAEPPRCWPVWGWRSGATGQPELSGGERQRVAIARALVATRPACWPTEPPASTASEPAPSST